MSATAAPPRPPLDGPPPPSPAPAPDPSPEGPRRLALWRIVVGCVIVVACAAATTVVFIKGEIKTLASDLSFNKALTVAPRALAPVGFGDPQTILLIGNDQRKHTTTQPVLPHSNEMLLVRIDPSKPWISMMSIPRELMVTLNTSIGPVTTRLNAALIYGGMSLLLSTIKQLTGLSVNHVVMIDFNQFKTAVDEIGCVYSTVDRRYYHVNTPYDEQYQEINLQPGYQKLCGTDALQFVSYRHGDTSLVRDARDQHFLLDVKQEYGPSLDSIGAIHKFERIFGQTVEVDHGLQTESGVENLLGTLITAESLRVRQVQFQVNLEPTGSNPCSCDTATPQQIAASVHSFLYGGDTLPTRSTAAAARAVHHRKLAAQLPLVPISASGLAQAQASARKLTFPLEFPRVQDAGGSVIPVALRDYQIHATNGRAYPAYVAVFSNGLLGQYYDVQGMTWTGAPMFQNPNQTVTVAGRTYALYYSGQRLNVVAWSEHGAVYWIHNTLTDAVGNGELLAIAEQTERLGTESPGRAPGVTDARHARLKDVAAPTRLGATASMGLAQKIGSIGGLLTLIAAPLLCLMLLRRRRELAELRGRLQVTLAREAQLTAIAAPLALAPASAPDVYTKYVSTRGRAAAVPRLNLRVAGIGGASIVVAGVAAVLLTGALGHQTAPHRVVSKPASVVPTVPVAVLNASTTQGAAGGLAQQLHSRGVKIAGVGNVVESRSSGLWILYAPGARPQATRLAGLLSARSPTIAPADSAAQAAAGTSAKVIVVIT